MSILVYYSWLQTKRMSLQQNMYEADPLPRYMPTCFTFPSPLPTMFLSHLGFWDLYSSCFPLSNSEIQYLSLQNFVMVQDKFNHPLLIYKRLLKLNVGKFTYIISGTKTLEGWCDSLGELLSYSDITTFNSSQS